MDKTLGLDMDEGSVSTENEVSHNEMGDHHVIQSYPGLNDSNSSMKMNNANYLGRSRVFLDGHMSIDKSTGVAVIFCSYCQKTWTSPKSSSTGNYRKHLMKHHPYELSGKDGVVGQVKLRDGLLRWMTQSCVGIETFDDNFNQFLRNAFHVEIGKSRLSQSLLEILDKQFEVSKSKVQSYFRLSVSQYMPSMVNHVAVSFHYKSMISLSDSSSLVQFIPQPATAASPPSTFIALAVHFINESWQLKNIVVGFMPVRGYPSPKVITGQISEQLGQYFDLTQLTSIVSSTANGEVQLPQESLNNGLAKFKVFCVASALQTCVQDSAAPYFGFANASAAGTATVTIPALLKLRAALIEMNSSPKNIDTLARINIQIANAQAGNPGLNEFTCVDVDHPNIWRSTLKMISAAMEQKLLIDTFLNQQVRAAGSSFHQPSAGSIVQLLQEDWRELHIIRQSLQTIETGRS
jgi:hypothetical protein